MVRIQFQSIHIDEIAETSSVNRVRIGSSEGVIPED